MNKVSEVTEKPRWAGFEHARTWVLNGWEKVQADRALWLGMSGIFLVIAALLYQIPFAGFLVVVMIAPMLLGGALLALDQGALPANSDSPAELAKRPLRQLLAVFNNESHIYTIVVLAILTLGLVVMLRIAEYLLGVGAYYSLTNVIAHRILPPWWWGLTLPIAIALNIALVMGLFFAVHLTLLARREPMVAVHDSFLACWRHASPLAALALMALGVGVVLWLGFLAWAPLGYLLLFTGGVAALAVLVTASYCAYREIFTTTGRTSSSL